MNIHDFKVTEFWNQTKNNNAMTRLRGLTCLQIQQLSRIKSPTRLSTFWAFKTLSKWHLKGFQQKATSNSRIPFSTTARCDKLFWDRVMWYGNVILEKALRCYTWRRSRYSRRNCLRLQHHRQKGKLFFSTHTFAYCSGNVPGLNKTNDHILGPQPLYSL